MLYLHGFVLGEDPHVIGGTPRCLADHVWDKQDSIPLLIGLQTNMNRSGGETWKCVTIIC